MRTKAIIHLDRFLANIEEVRKRVGIDRRVCLPIKANAYGHGALEIANASLEAGVYCFGVATVAEGTELRKGGIKAPILLFSQPHPSEIPEIIETGLSPFVSDTWFVDALNAQAATKSIKLPVHVKIDTGMGRIGCSAEEAAALARRVTACPGLALDGIATHFAVADSADGGDRAYTKSQLSLFKEAVDAVKNAGVEAGIVHAANSGAVILHPDAWLDMVRPGILLYGYKAVEENQIPGFPYEPLQVKPVMELITTVALIKKVKKGDSVSYGRIWKAPRDTNIAVLPIGYADGFPRLASGKWKAVIDGKTYPQAGVICMDHCCLDIGPEHNVKRWDEAVIFGGAAESAAALARTIGTIPYEITCGISGRVPREYHR